MLFPYFLAALAAQVATTPQVPVGPQVPAEQTLRLPLPREATRLPQRPAPDAPPEPERIPIDLGPDAPTSGPPQQIDLLVEAAPSEAANAAQLKECEDQREAGVVAGEIVVCRELPADTSQLYSGSREAWLKDYAARTMNAGTIPPPDVDGTGLAGGITIVGLCFIGPCPKDPALIIDVEAIPPPPAGSDAERVAQGLEPLKDDDAPLSDEARRRVEEELGLPEVPER